MEVVMEQNEISRKAAIAKWFRMSTESLPDIMREANKLTKEDIDELAPDCAAALGKILKD
jgi:hypothetical protein